jgi:hypothetical protein
MATWRELLVLGMEGRNDSFDNIVSNTMTDAEMDKKFDNGYGVSQGCSFTVWTKSAVYFPLVYDGAEWVGSVSRNPDGIPTAHQGSE